MAQTTTDTAASTVSGAGAASSFSGGTGTEAEFGSLGALSPTWWEPEDGSEPEPWLTPDQASSVSLNGRAIAVLNCGITKKRPSWTWQPAITSS